jgi:glycerol-1-phosphate dehydrogenase [NAD(P)+]
MLTSLSDFPIYIGNDATGELIHFCRQKALTQFFMVVDQNTTLALGKKVEQSLTQAGISVKTIFLAGDDIIADESTLVQALLQVGEDARPFIAVGSGTITDITRYVSYVTRMPFISLPTAPSVDGYTSMNAPLVIQRVKETIKAHGPMAVFADLDTLCQAPKAMIAAGFGDMLGKLTALADWELSRLFMDEPFDAEVAARAARALNSCIENVAEIGACSEKGVRILLEGLIETGLCMLKVHMSHPASGSEHHVSHFWEMKLLQDNRPAILHGAKVGVATAIMAGAYQYLRQLTPDQRSSILAEARLPDRETEVNAIRRAFGPMADQLIAIQEPYLSMTPEVFEAFKHKISAHWPEILKIAARVPEPDKIKGWLMTVGGPATPSDLGFSDAYVKQAVGYAYCLRSHFTLLTFRHLLGWKSIF